jgi:hypothetical protein
MGSSAFTMRHHGDPRSRLRIHGYVVTTLIRSRVHAYASLAQYCHMLQQTLERGRRGPAKPNKQSLMIDRASPPSKIGSSIDVRWRG